MSEIIPGESVEYIGGDVSIETSGPCSLMIGAIYIIDSVGDYADQCIACGRFDYVEVAGFLDPDWVYCSCQFKPIRDGQERVGLPASIRICEPVDG